MAKPSTPPFLPSQPTDLLPNMLATDPLDALLWWLTNPLLVFFHPDLAAQRLAEAPTMAPQQRRELVLRVRGVRATLRASKALPTGLPEMRREQVYALLDQVEEKRERDEVRLLAQRLTDCELPWLHAQLTKALQARAEALASMPEYQL